MSRRYALELTSALFTVNKKVVTPLLTGGGGGKYTDCIAGEKKVGKIAPNSGRQESVVAAVGIKKDKKCGHCNKAKYVGSSENKQRMYTVQQKRNR